MGHLYHGYVSHNQRVTNFNAIPFCLRSTQFWPIAITPLSSQVKRRPKKCLLLLLSHVLVYNSLYHLMPCCKRLHVENPPFVDHFGKPMETMRFFHIFLYVDPRIDTKHPRTIFPLKKLRWTRGKCRLFPFMDITIDIIISVIILSCKILISYKDHGNYDFREWYHKIHDGCW